ncbi:MAG: tyrosine-type recombinase/integrase [Pikeienuella sp.]|uniref:tyrosine-type recombinase/integrase n=1 Tax=Pikeienuella sp. TaxID=2831957 RepID=UPI00391DC015
MTKLTAAKVRALESPGMYGDGGGLYLCVGSGDARSWILRTMVHGKRRELGIGSASLIPLAEAREAAQALRKVARQGGDPDTVRKRESLTFEAAAKRVHANLLPTFRNAKTGENWLASMENHVFPIIGARPIHTLGPADVLKVLTPLWTETHETARRLKQRIASVFDWAKGAGQYPDENPVNGLKKALPQVKTRAEHRAAMDWRDLPAFMAELRERDGVSARTLEFLILTGLRSAEVRGARWCEIKDGVWTVPGERMKRGLPHRVPLSKPALTALEAVKGLDEDLIFPSVQEAARGKAKVQSVNVFSALFKRMGREGFTTHGFRSTFRDWCSESAKAPREVAEAALAHATGDAVERAYARSDLFERRRALMDAWGRYATGARGAGESKQR